MRSREATRRQSAPATRGALAIDVRRDVVYLVHLEGHGGRPTHARFRREPIDPSLFSENPLEAVASAIGRISQGLDLRKIPATIVLANNAEAVRVRRFPPLKPKALASAADIAMRADSLAAEGATVRRHFTQRRGVGADGVGFVEAVLIEANASAVEDARTLARLTGLRLARVTSPALAIGRAVGALGEAAGTCLVIDLMGPATTLSVHSDGRFLLSREGDVAADLLTDDLESFLSMAAPADGGGGGAEGAEEPAGAKSAAALADPGVGGVIPISAQKLSTEIERSNRYLVAQFRQTIDRIYFAGPSAIAAALMDHLRGELQIPIALLTPENVVPAGRLEGAPTCSSARCLGAALEMLAPPRERRYEMIDRARSAGPRVPRLAIAVGLVVAAALPIGVLEWRLARESAAQSRLREEIARAETPIAPEGIAGDPEQAAAAVAAYRALREREPRWSRPLASLSEALPEGVWLTGLSLQEAEGGEEATLEAILGGEGAVHGERVGGADDALGADGAGGAAAGPARLLVAGRASDARAVSALIARLHAEGLLDDPRLVSFAGPDADAPADSAATTRRAHPFVLSCIPALSADPAGEI